MILMHKTDNPSQLAAIYTTADCFFNPTLEDNYPTVNLEAEACGTVVLAYDSGGCSETVSLSKSKIVMNYDQAVCALAELLEN